MGVLINWLIQFCIGEECHIEINAIKATGAFLYAILRWGDFTGLLDFSLIIFGKLAYFAVFGLIDAHDFDSDLTLVNYLTQGLIGIIDLLV